MNISRKKVSFFATAVVLIVIVLAAMYAMWQRSFSAKITAVVSPADSTLIISSKSYKAGVIRLRPGTYKITVSKQGFTGLSKTVTVSKGDNQYVGIVLLPDSPTTANWYTNHPSDAKLLEGISSKNFDLFSAEQIKKLPLIKSLPFIDQFFRIDYGPSKLRPTDPTAVALYIKYYSEQGKQQALDWLKFKGYDPDKLEIIYAAATVQQ